MNSPALFRPRRWRLLTTLMLCGAVCSGPVWAQWKWRDKSGQMHISDVPPPADVTEKDILQRPPSPPRNGPLSPAAPASEASAPAPTAGASAPRVEPELESRRAKAEQEEKAKRQALEDANAATKADNCSRARRQITALESGQRIARTNDSGEREILDDKARAEEMQRARNIVSSDCAR